MHGHHGRALEIDLTTGRAAWRELDSTRLRRFVGGIGLGASLLYEYAPPGVDALAPENPLIFASAPLVGTSLTTTAKYAVVTKSPLSGFIADSLSSSHFALELKRLGLDAIVVTGAAPSLVSVVVAGERVEIRDAEPLRGRTSGDTEALLSAQLGMPGVRVASIGEAGERRVRFATISNGGRHAGRGGVGAVMGSKNLKAIAVQGDRDTHVADPRRLAALAETLRRRSVGPVTDKYRSVGTVANLALFNRLGTLPARNFQHATFDAAEALSGESLTESNFSRRHGCASCTIRCERLFRSSDPAGRPQRLEYETLFALGPLCGVSDPDAVIAGAALCDAYGLDAISTGGTIAWAMEALDRGLLPDAPAGGLRFGDGASVLAAIHAIGRREGVGALLGEGSRRAARVAGGDSADWAMHVKGLELPGYDPRSLKTMALGLAVNPRGACHNRSGAYEADFSGDVDRFTGDAARGSLVAASEDFAAVLDSLIVCKFLRKCFTDFYAEAAEVLTGVTGWEYAAADLRAAGTRIHTIKKLFNVREGWRREDDWLPGRLLAERVPSGGSAGAIVDPGELRDMIGGYYRARRWTADGLVPDAELDALGLAPAAERTPASRPFSEEHLRR